MVKVAIVFPGQGSQSLGMLSDFELQYPVITDTFAEASDVIHYDVWQLIQQGPEAQLNQTEYTQVAMLTADVAIYRLLQQENAIQVDYMAGHSLGEYPALVCANSLTFPDAINLVSQRGRIMQQTVSFGTGAMAAIIGLSNETVQELCEAASYGDHSVVSPANYNAIGQVVVAGHTAAVERVIHLAEEAGASLAKIIPVSVPCHCSLLKDAAEQFAEYLGQTHFNVPETQVISNLDAHPYQTVEDIQHKLKAQLFNPVRWVETIQFLKAQDVAMLIECGPGKVLTGLSKRIDRSLKAMSIYDTISLENVCDQLQ